MKYHKNWIRSQTEDPLKDILSIVPSKVSSSFSSSLSSSPTSLNGFTKDSNTNMNPSTISSTIHNNNGLYPTPNTSTSSATTASVVSHYSHEAAYYEHDFNNPNAILNNINLRHKQHAFYHGNGNGNRDNNPKTLQGDKVQVPQPPIAQISSFFQPSITPSPSSFSSENNDNSNLSNSVANADPSSSYQHHFLHNQTQTANNHDNHMQSAAYEALMIYKAEMTQQFNQVQSELRENSQEERIVRHHIAYNANSNNTKKNNPTDPDPVTDDVNKNSNRSNNPYPLANYGCTANTTAATNNAATTAVIPNNVNSSTTVSLPSNPNLTSSSSNSTSTSKRGSSALDALALACEAAEKSIEIDGSSSSKSNSTTTSRFINNHYTTTNFDKSKFFGKFVSPCSILTDVSDMTNYYLQQQQQQQQLQQHPNTNGSYRNVMEPSLSSSLSSSSSSTITEQQLLQLQFLSQQHELEQQQQQQQLQQTQEPIKKRQKITDHPAHPKNHNLKVPYRITRNKKNKLPLKALKQQQQEQQQQQQPNSNAITKHNNQSKRKPTASRMKSNRNLQLPTYDLEVELALLRSNTHPHLYQNGAANEHQHQHQLVVGSGAGVGVGADDDVTSHPNPNHFAECLVKPDALGNSSQSLLSEPLAPMGTKHSDDVPFDLTVRKNWSDQVTINDVLCGRGGLTNNHPGNVFFRSLVRNRQEAYLFASKRDKAFVAHGIVDVIRTLKPPGRFLKKDRKVDVWVEIGNKKAREKTSQALREKAPELMELLQKEFDVGYDQVDSGGGSCVSSSNEEKTSTSTTKGKRKRSKLNNNEKRQKDAIMKKKDTINTTSVPHLQYPHSPEQHHHQQHRSHIEE